MAGLLLLAAGMPAASAANRVTITIDANFQTGVETFSASGGFCASGTSGTSNLAIVGGGHGLTFHLDKTLTCDDGSGSLVIAVNAATHAAHPEDQSGWAVMGGTGRWAAASGGGNLVGTYTDTGVIDQYTGSLRG